jgi:hypothetical protein
MAIGDAHESEIMDTASNRAFGNVVLYHFQVVAS